MMVFSMKYWNDSCVLIAHCISQTYFVSSNRDGELRALYPHYLLLSSFGSVFEGPTTGIRWEQTWISMCCTCYCSQREISSRIEGFQGCANCSFFPWSRSYSWTTLTEIECIFSLRKYLLHYHLVYEKLKAVGLHCFMSETRLLSFSSTWSVSLSVWIRTNFFMVLP